MQNAIRSALAAPWTHLFFKSNTNPLKMLIFRNIHDYSIHTTHGSSVLRKTVDIKTCFATLLALLPHTFSFLC